MNRTFFALSTALVLLSAPALAADDKAKPAAGKPAASAAALSGKSFVEQAAMTDMAEKQMAQLAQKKASSEQVKQFAQMMINDHDKTSKELSSLAQRKGLAPPAQLDQRHKAMLDRLEKASGPQFDREYMQIQVQAHQQAIDLFQRAGQQQEEKDLQAFAQKTTPALQQHLSRAKQVVAALPGGTAAGEGKKKQ